MPAVRRVTWSLTTRPTGSRRLPPGSGQLTAADYTPARLAEAMLESDYPLQALLYSVALHRYLRWRQPGYAPEQHLGGVLYLYLRGMCGPQTPVVDGQPCGVFAWRPPAALVTELSDAAGRRPGAAMTAVIDRFDPRKAAEVTGLLAQFQEAGVLECGRHSRRPAAGASRPGAGRACAAGGGADGSSCAARLGVPGPCGGAHPDRSGSRRGRRGGGVRRAGGVRAGRVAVARSGGVAGGVRGQPARRIGAAAPRVGIRCSCAAGLLYLDRYWQQEQLVAGELTSRAQRSLDDPPWLDEQRFTAALDRLFPPARVEEVHQREAAATAAQRWVTVLAGVPVPARPPRLRASWRCWPTSPARLRSSPSLRRPGRRRRAWRKRCATRWVSSRRPIRSGWGS